MAKTKTDCQKKHAIRRALTRYNISLNEYSYNSLVKMIKTNKSEIVRKQSHRVTIHKIIYADQELFCVYDKMRKTIVTFLTKEMAYNPLDLNWS